MVIGLYVKGRKCTQHAKGPCHLHYGAVRWLYHNGRRPESFVVPSGAICWHGGELPLDPLRPGDLQAFLGPELLVKELPNGVLLAVHPDRLGLAVGQGGWKAGLLRKQFGPATRVGELLQGPDDADPDTIRRFEGFMGGRFSFLPWWRREEAERALGPLRPASARYGRLWGSGGRGWRDW